MRTLLACLCLLAAFAAISTFTHPLALAQDKKKAGYIEVTEGKDGKFRFTVRTGEGKLLAMSGPTGFATQKDATKAIEDLKDVLRTAKVVTGKKSTKPDK